MIYTTVCAKLFALHTYGAARLPDGVRKVHFSWCDLNISDLRLISCSVGYFRLISFREYAMNHYLAAAYPDRNYITEGTLMRPSHKIFKIIK
jgi:hypothetical protein